MEDRQCVQRREKVLSERSATVKWPRPRRELPAKLSSEDTPHGRTHVHACQSIVRTRVQLRAVTAWPRCLRIGIVMGTNAKQRHSLAWQHIVTSHAVSHLSLIHI